MKYAGYGLMVTGVAFIAFGVVSLIMGGKAVNFVSIGAGLVQIMSGVSIVSSVKQMERYDV